MRRCRHHLPRLILLQPELFLGTQASLGLVKAKNCRELEMCPWSACPSHAALSRSLHLLGHDCPYL
jgi:hypothetical protein